MSVRQRHNVQISEPAVPGGASTPDHTAAPRGTLVFAHGFGCDQNMWRLITPAFSKEYRIVLFDYLGHGASDFAAYNADRYATLDAYADDVLDILHELNLTDVTFIGHSVSASIGMLAAIREPERFKNLVLVAPSPCFINDGDYVGGFTRENIHELLNFLDANHLGWSTAMAPVIIGNPDRPELGRELEQSFCRTDPAVARQFAHVTFLADNRADLPNVRVPCLILQCATDMIAPPTVGEFVHRHLPNSRLVTLDANGHCPHLSHPQATLTAIREYLSTSPTHS